MIHSMTGFGKGVAQNNKVKVTIEVRSVNSKQADIGVRIPSEFRFLEMELRKRLADHLKRGKIDLFLSFEQLHPAEEVTLNGELAGLYWEQIKAMVEQAGIPTSQDPLHLILKLPGVVSADNSLHQTEEELTEVTLAALAEAIAQLQSFREQEGIALYNGFAQNIARISELLNEVEPFEAERVADVRQRLEEGLKKYIETDYDRSRLEQEMIYYIEKLDVNEEKTRLRNHLAYFTETLNLPEVGQGRKLGFIAQEIGREINTLGSKSNHAVMQKLVVMMKDELEQIKEQVLNVL